MADIYRQVYTSFWQDGFVMSLTPEEKYFYLYLITNSKTTLCGIYELPVKIIEFETGYNRDTVEKLLQKFEEYGKIKYSNKTKEICVCNFTKYNVNRSPKVQSAVTKGFETVKDKNLIPYAYPMYTISSVTVTDTDTVTDTVTDNKSPKIPYNEIKNLYNEICKSYPKVKTLSDKRKTTIKARLNTYTIDDFKELFEKAETSNFLKGKNNNDWSATFDWLIKDANMAKTLDGNYNKDNPQGNSKRNYEITLDKNGHPF